VHHGMARVYTENRLQRSNLCCQRIGCRSVTGCVHQAMAALAGPSHSTPTGLPSVHLCAAYSSSSSSSSSSQQIEIHAGDMPSDMKAGMLAS
jgi:hypothetical protein